MLMPEPLVVIPASAPDATMTASVMTPLSYQSTPLATIGPLPEPFHIAFGVKVQSVEPVTVLSARARV